MPPWSHCRQLMISIVRLASLKVISRTRSNTGYQAVPGQVPVPTYIKCKCFSPPPHPWNAAEIWKSRAGAACREEADSWCLIPGWEGAIPSTLDLQSPCLSQQSVFGLFSIFWRRLMKVMAEPPEGTLIGGGRRRETYQLQDSSLLEKILVYLIFWA